MQLIVAKMIILEVRSGKKCLFDRIEILETSSFFWHQRAIYGLWSMVYGLRSTVYGIRNTEYGIRFKVSYIRGVCCVLYVHAMPPYGVLTN